MPRVAVQWHTLINWLRSVIESNPWFAAALAGGAGLRLLAMIGYPGALWFAGDSYVYLGAALRPQPNLSKTTGYSLFLKALEPFHSLTLVAGLQHLMGLGIAVMIYVLARRSGVSQGWATAATLPVLFDGFFIEDEHMVMAETLFTFSSNSGKARECGSTWRLWRAVVRLSSAIPFFPPRWLPGHSCGCWR